MALKIVIKFVLFLLFVVTINARVRNTKSNHENVCQFNKLSICTWKRICDTDSMSVCDQQSFNPLYTGGLFHCLRYYPFHPVILTRPKITTTVAPPKTTTAATTTEKPTTPEPPEHENEEAGTTWSNTGTFSTAFFGTGEEVELDEETTIPMQWIRSTPMPWIAPARPRNIRRQTTTPQPTTTETTEEPPENEEQGQNKGQSQSDLYQTMRGFCFCTPFSFCPRGSIRRGGYCWNMPYFYHPFIRCCYRPSLARKFYRYVNIAGEMKK